MFLKSLIHTSHDDDSMNATEGIQQPPPKRNRSSEDEYVEDLMRCAMHVEAAFEVTLRKL